MSAPKPQYIANLLVELGINPDFKKLDEVCFTLIKNQIPTLSDEEIYDYIEENKKDIANELFIKVNDAITDGVDLTFDIKEEDSDFYIQFFDKPEIFLLRKLQKNTTKYFEVFCTKILDKLGGNSLVVGGTDDGGIDFISSELKLNGLPKNSTKGSNIFVVGQAKRKGDGSHIKETDLRGFVGASVKKINELKKTRSEQYGIFQPTILAFWTTSDFHSDAKIYARDLGIWYLNGIALCQLALRLGIKE